MLRLRTFGGFSLEGDEGSVSGATLQKRRAAVLVLLASMRDRSVSRDKLLAYLWPDADTERARHSLSQLLYALRRDLKAAAIVVTAGEQLQIDREVLWSDVAEFEEAIERGENERAVALYTGAFLDGWFLPDAPEYEHWVEHERGRLAQQATMALRKLAEAATGSNDHDAAVRWWRRLVTMDPLAARPAIGLMTALAAAGDRPAALRHAQIYEALLRQEIDSAPDPAVVALAEHLRTEASTSPSTVSKRLPEPPPASPPADVAAAEAKQPRGEPRVPPRRKHVVPLGGVLALALLAVTWLLVRRPSASQASVAGAVASAADSRSVAVLPFLNISAEPENEYFSDGMTEELINTLARVKGLRVPARTSAFTFKGKLIGVSEIGKQLHVAHVLEGSVRRTGKRLRVTAQLIDVASGYELWSDVYDRDLTDIFQVQEDIARAIAARLEGDLFRDADGHAAHRPTANADAYDLYLRGRYFWNQRTYASLLKSIDYYQRALALDGNYAMAYAGLADSYAIIGANGYRPLSEVMPRAAASGARALALDSSLSSVHATQALLRWLSWDWATADTEFRRSIVLDSAYAPARLWYALYLSGMRRHDEAIREMTRARDLDPLSLVINTELGRVLELARHDDEAESAYRRTIEIDSTYYLANYLLTQLHYRKGQSALAASDLARLRPSGATDFAELRAYGYARAGNSAAARQMLTQLQQLSGQRYVSPYAVACIYAALGDRASAVRYLKDAYSRHTSEMSLVAADPLLDPLRSDPGYIQLLHRMRLN